MLRRALALLGLAAVVVACTAEVGDGPGAPDEEAPAGHAKDAGARPPAAPDSGISAEDAGADAADAATDAGDDAPVVEEFAGEATYYDAEGKGACGVTMPSDYLVAAMNGVQYSKAVCGTCVAVTGPKGDVVVRILDKCPGCKKGDLDLSITAFTKIADKSAGRVKITWHFVDCPF